LRRGSVPSQAREDRGPSLEKKKVTLQILRDIDYQIQQFLIVQLFTSLLVGVATWLALRWIGFEQAAFWGLLAGIFNSIPYFGPVIVTGRSAWSRFSSSASCARSFSQAVQRSRLPPRRHAPDAVSHQPARRR
jgi:hypothetical protein